MPVVRVVTIPDVQMTRCLIWRICGEAARQQERAATEKMHLPWKREEIKAARSLWWKARLACWQWTPSALASDRSEVTRCAGPSTATAGGGWAAHPFGRSWRRGGITQQRRPTVMKSNLTVMRVSLWWLERSEWALSHRSRAVGFALPAHPPRSLAQAGAPIPARRAQPVGRSERDTDHPTSLAMSMVSFPEWWLLSLRVLAYEETVQSLAGAGMNRLLLLWQCNPVLTALIIDGKLQLIIPLQIAAENTFLGDVLHLAPGAQCGLVPGRKGPCRSAFFKVYKKVIFTIIFKVICTKVIFTIFFINLFVFCPPCKHRTE